MPSETPRRLGRGLGALLAPGTSGQSRGGGPATEGTVQRIPLGQIRPNPFQPRKEFAPEELAELASSLKASGLLQPVTVRSVRSTGSDGESGRGDGARFELLAGERRYRAALGLGWVDIPAVVRDVDDRTALTLALVENLQRADLNPIEEADGYASLIRDFTLTQQQVADAVGKERSTVANMLRLLNLPSAVRTMLRDGQLSLGHARALLALNTEREIVAAAHETVARGLTVRDVEGLGRQQNGAPKRHKRATKAAQRLDSHGREMEDRLRRHLQTDVTLAVTSHQRGQISIQFYSNDDLERLLELILGPTGETL